MSTLIVSDLHLGDPRRLPEADGEFCNLLAKERWEQVIILGDLFDLWSSSFLEISRKHSTVLAALASLSCSVVYVPGNHDSEFKGLTRLNSLTVHWPTYQFRSGSISVTAVHGDTYDEVGGTLNKIAAWITRLADRIAQWAAGPGVSITRSVLKSLSKMGDARKDYAQGIYKRAVEDLPGDLIILGHTHLPSEPQEVGDKLVANSGDFGPQHMSYLVIDEGKTELRTVDSI